MSLKEVWKRKLNERKAESWGDSGRRMRRKMTRRKRRKIKQLLRKGRKRSYKISLGFSDISFLTVALMVNQVKREASMEVRKKVDSEIRFHFSRSELGRL